MTDRHHPLLSFLLAKSPLVTECLIMYLYNTLLDSLPFLWCRSSKLLISIDPINLKEINWLFFNSFSTSLNNWNLYFLKRKEGVGGNFNNMFFFKLKKKMLFVAKVKNMNLGVMLPGFKSQGNYLLDIWSWASHLISFKLQSLPG